MPDLLTTLRDHDAGILPALAQLWGVTITNLKDAEIIEALQAAMLEPERAEVVWDTLDDKQRGALQMLLASNGTMPMAQFSRLFGEIRKMGRGQIEREQPHRNPQSIAEALYYRGMVSQTFKKSKKGTTAMVYVPDDMMDVLPVHKTAYENLEAEPEAFVAEISPLEESDVFNIEPADTSIVDDMTTVLAYLRLYSAGVEDDSLLPIDVERLSFYLMDPNPVRLDFMLGVGISADLITTQEGRAYPKRDELQRWLGQSRSEQLRVLVQAWRTSTLYRDMWHVPGLHPDPDAGFPYDPLIGREAFIEFLVQYAPQNEWWSLDEFIEIIKNVDADFQRPSGDYDSWYIRSDDGEYLHGFDSWDAVEGALLEFYCKMPMHWLGLTDSSLDAVRLTAYGRAFLAGAEWPHPPEPSENITLHEDEKDIILIASRKVSRLDRFQLARFTTWGQGGAPFHYRLDADGIKIAEGQGITTEHIAAFVKRQLGNIPPTIARLLGTWQGGAKANVTFERLLVLRTTSPEILDRIYNEPALRRYLGARLGEMAVVIRADQADDLRHALGDAGIDVEAL